MVYQLLGYEQGKSSQSEMIAQIHERLVLQPKMTAINVKVVRRES
jgi:hypothetical protein